MEKLRIGSGVDVHPLVDGKKMYLACLEWPAETKGLEGHSDGDVAAHAVCDSLLSAAGLGDLGTVFGVSDPKWQGASGSTLLTEVHRLISKAGFDILNISVQVVGNSPKISMRRAEAQVAMANAIGGAPVSVSGTTTDGLGLTGRGEGIAAFACALLAIRQ